jgi:hypothetical protein
VPLMCDSAHTGSTILCSRWVNGANALPRLLTKQIMNRCCPTLP